MKVRRRRKLVVRKRVRRKSRQSLIGSKVLENLDLAFPDGWVAVDTEGTGLLPWYGHTVTHEPALPFVFVVSNSVLRHAYVQWPVDPTTRNVRAAGGFDFIRKVLLDETITKVFHHATYDILMLEFLGFGIKGPVFDTMIAMHVINPAEPSLGLKPLAEKYLDYPATDQDELLESVKRVRKEVQHDKRFDGPKKNWIIAGTPECREEGIEADYFTGDQSLIRTYAIGDVKRTAELYVNQLSHLDEDEENGGKLWEICNLEHELRPIVQRMRTRGIAIDKEKVAELQGFYQTEMERNKKIYEKKCGKDFNPRSQKQMVEYFFVQSGNEPLEYTNARCCLCAGKGCAACQFSGKNPKADKLLLGSLAFDAEGNPKDEIARALLNSKAAGHMLTSFVSVYEKLMTYEKSTGCWCLHPDIQQVGPVTGRLSCRKPNLMQLASDTSGRKQTDVPYRIREVPITRPGFRLIFPDYSQIEVWIFASLAQEETMLNLLCDGEDIHGGVAHRCWPDEFDLRGGEAVKEKMEAGEKVGKREKEIYTSYKRVRNRGKLMEFLTIYGGGPKAAAGLIGCSVAEAASHLEHFYRALPGIKEYMNKTVATARKQGYIENSFGRVYPIEKDKAYRAVNYTVQGAAADVIKRAMVRVHKELNEKKDGAVEELVPIHDEIVCEVKEEYYSFDLLREVVSLMQEDYKKVGCPKPFPVGMKVSDTTWIDATPVTLSE